MDHPDPTSFVNAVADDAPGPGDVRHRDSLFLLAHLSVEGTSGPPIAVRVRNLSAGGAMAELSHPIPTDRAIAIELRGVGRVAGRIAWQTAGRIGIAFDTPVDPQRARKPIGRAKG